MSKDLNVEGMTRDDFEQLFSDHTERYIKALEETEKRLETKMDKGFDDVLSIVERIDQRTHEDTTTALNEVVELKSRVAVLENALLHPKNVRA